MDLGNQKRVKELADQYGPGNLLVLLGAADSEAAGLAAETVTAGDPTYAGPLTGVPLGLSVYHIVEEEIRSALDPDVYGDHVASAAAALDVPAISEIMESMRKQFGKCS